jgi:hypothetical protein
VREGTGAVGVPTTVVETAELTQAAILEGIRNGRTFVDLTGSGDVHLDFSIRVGTTEARMGGTAAAADTALALLVNVRAPRSALLEVLDGSEVLERHTLGASSGAPALTLPALAGKRAIWLKVRGLDGTLLASSRAILVHSTQEAPAPRLRTVSSCVCRLVATGGHMASDLSRDTVGLAPSDRGHPLPRSSWLGANARQYRSLRPVRNRDPNVSK